MKLFTATVVLLILSGCGSPPRQAAPTKRDMPGAIPAACEGARPHQFQETGLEQAHVVRAGLFEPSPVPARQSDSTPVQTIVRSNGQVCAAEALKWAGWKYDWEAAQDVRKWQFGPAKMGGEAVDVNMISFVRHAQAPPSNLSDQPATWVTK